MCYNLKMKNFDSLTLKYFFEENKDFINGAIVQKIQLPSRHEVILNLRNLQNSNSTQKKLYININPKYPHICFVDEESLKKRDIKIPKNPPMFCMQLRKYLNGSKIKDFKLVQYERILEFYFDYFDEIGSISKLCLSVELMGKHSNIILYNTANKIITGSIHNISQDKSSIREIYGGIKYIYPPLKEKLDILNTSYATFFEIMNKGIKEFSFNFYYFTQNITEEIIKKFNIDINLFNFLQNLQNSNEKNFIINYWQDLNPDSISKNSINKAIDDYFSNYIFDEILSNKKSKLQKIFQKEFKKLEKIISLPPNEAEAEKYKQKGDFINSYLYKIKQEDRFLKIEELNLTIELDNTITPAKNAQKYYAQYKKAKTAFEYNKKRFDEAKQKLEYLNTINFNIENATDFEELEGSKEELEKFENLNNPNHKSKQENKIDKITKINHNGFEIYIGKNNKQNDYLISKIANPDDLWFHGQGFPSCHIILKIPSNKKEPDKKTLEFCAKLTKENSKAKFSGKTPIIMTRKKFLKKPPNTYPGFVTYKNEIEIIIE